MSRRNPYTVRPVTWRLAPRPYRWALCWRGIWVGLYRTQREAEAEARIRWTFDRFNR